MHTKGKTYATWNGILLPSASEPLGRVSLLILDDGLDGPVLMSDNGSGGDGCVGGVEGRGGGYLALGA